MKKNIKRVLIIALILNIILTIAKIAAGVFGNSPSLITDGINSSLDIAVSVMLFITIRISSKKPDKNHPYGHEKFEGLAYLVLTIILITVGGFFVFRGIIDFINYFNNNLSLESPSMVPLIVAIIAIIIKIGMFIMIRTTAYKYKLPSLKGDSYNHLFDIFATSAALAGIIFAKNNIFYMEYIAQLFIGILIVQSSIKMFKEAVSYLTDEAPERGVVKAIKLEILSVKGVLEVDDLKVRKHMNHLYVEVEIGVLYSMTLEESHQIAEAVHDLVEQEFDVIHCFVHVNPHKK